MVCQIINTVITVLSPEIQDSVKMRSVLLNLVHSSLLEDDQGVLVEVIKCQQHFRIFAPSTSIYQSESLTIFEVIFHPLDLSRLHPSMLCTNLSKRMPWRCPRLVGIDWSRISFGILDDDSSVEGVRNVITSWLEKTVVYNPSARIDLCQQIMS